MNYMERYIGKTVMAAILLVLVMLTGLQGFILFVNQLGDLGKAHYDIMQALLFIGLNIPYQVYLFFPMASLLGSLLGLGILGNHHELLVMRAAGMSIGRITLAVFKAALLLIALMSVCGEMIFPKWVLQANVSKTKALGSHGALVEDPPLWLRANQDIIMIGTLHSPWELEDVIQFHFDADYRLLFTRHIARAVYEHTHWVAHDMAQTNFTLLRLTRYQASSIPWEVQLDPRVLRTAQQEPDEMTLGQLHHYLWAQKISHQNVQNYQLAYWQRLMLPATTVVMMLLAIPFIFGPLRAQSMGSQLMVGAVVGFGFYILNRLCGALSQIYQFSAILAAVGPTLLSALLGCYVMRRAR